MNRILIYVNCVLAALIAASTFYFIILINLDNPDYQFNKVRLLASEEPINTGRNTGQFSLWQGENYLLLNTHGGEDGYILDSWVDGEKAAVSYAIDTAVNGESYKADTYDRIVHDRRCQLNINDIDVIYVSCCYPAAHRNGSIELPYVVGAGRIASSEDMLDNVFGGTQIAYKEVPIIILGVENNVTYSNGFYTRGDEDVRTIKVWTSALKTKLVAAHNLICSI